jgi:hypothetical protein
MPFARIDWRLASSQLFTSSTIELLIADIPLAAQPLPCGTVQHKVWLFPRVE